MKMKKMIGIILSTLTTLTMIPVLPAAAATAADKYKDVSVDDWFYQSVQYVDDQGIMKGMSADAFEPGTAMSRGMIVTVLHRIEKEPSADPSAFTDVPADTWFTEPVAWASAEGIVNGYSTDIFGPNDDITREQIATILFRYADKKGYDVSGRADLSGYSDKDAVSDWAKDALAWTNVKGLIIGLDDSTLSPGTNATRAQVAEILMRFDQLDQSQSQDVYLTLVNKNKKLPDNWLDMIELVTTENSLGREFQVEKEALEQFEKLREAMLLEGIDIELDSTYRSVQRQEELWAEFEEKYGMEYCQKYVAVPGYSEHHTGLAIDVCLIKDGEVIDDNDAMIAEKEIFAKIHEKLADYGFILRYLPDKEDVTGYAYEPWHFRYVGEEAAREIAQRGITLEEYLADAPVSKTGKVWQYSYAGVEHPYLEAISDYLCQYDADNLELADGMIPCITSVEIDNSDESDIRLWGIFDIYNYSLNDKTLVEENGKRLLGLFHLSQTEEGLCTVKEVSFVEEGDDQAVEALCEGHNLALEGLKNPIVTEESRCWYISEYVRTSGLAATHYQSKGNEARPINYEKQNSPEWVALLPEAQETDSLIVVDVTIGSNAVLTMHEKNAEGVWEQTLDEAAFIGKNGLGKTREGDLMTPVGSFGFNAALGINDDPGCVLDYTKVNDSHYWVGDSLSDHYNKLVSTEEYTDFNVDDSEHIVDYPNAYKYILNTTYNEEGTPGKGSAIFLHCYREERTYTGGCISIPYEKMEYVMKHVKKDTKILIRKEEK